MTSDGVTVQWRAEEAEAGDKQPHRAVVCRKAMNFVPVSFELSGDSSIARQVGALLADATNVQKGVFTVGNGTTEPALSRPSPRSAAASSPPARRPSPPATSTTPGTIRPHGGRQNARFMMSTPILNGLRVLIRATGMTGSVIDDSGSAPRGGGWTVVVNDQMDNPDRPHASSADDFAAPARF